jgi:hypothetical protein
MSENNNIDDNDSGREETSGDGSRAQDAAKNPKKPRDSVSVSKTTFEDGSEMTEVSHPPQRLRKSGELIDALRSGAIDLDDFKEGCAEGMNAMKAIPCKNGTIAYEPDWPMRLAFRKFVTETVEGMPVKRQEIISRKITTEEDLLKRAHKSPALRRSLMKALIKMEETIVSNKRGSKKATAEPASKEV